MFLLGMCATTLVAAAACTLAMVTSQDLVAPVEAGQPDAGRLVVREQEDAYVPGEVLVLLSAEMDRNGVPDAAEDFAGVEAAVHGKMVRRIVLSRRHQVLRVKLPAGKSVEAALAENWGAKDRRILAVEPNYRVRIARTPNDPLFPQLWGLNNTGQMGGTEDADIDAPEAWDVATGVPEGSSVIVAVIDTGIDYLHPDLAENMWVNPEEIGGNNIDDDGNGYIDDVHGYDFYQDDGDPSDAYGHGTHCAGTIAGVGDNGLGVTGVNWRCKLMAVRFLSAGGGGNTADAIEAINYAVANGAKILSNSWGGSGYSESLEAAIINARDNGVLFVAAAGNYSSNNDSEAFYPASYEVSNVISVAATNHRDALAGFSNYGAKSVHVGAPGVSILSCVPTYKTLFFENFQGAATPGFEGTQMMLEGPVNRWGTVTESGPPPPLPASLSPPPPPPPPPSPPPPPEENIAARGDWENSWPYLGDSDGSIVTPAIDTRELRGLTLEFEYRYETGSTDELTVDVWDGTSWQTVFSRYSNCCYYENFYWWTRIDIPEPYRNEKMKVRFRWVTDGEDNNYFGAEIDNIRIRCIDDHANNYAFRHGTSMAAPHVAGVAALVMANRPGPFPPAAVGPESNYDGISLEELKARLVWAGDRIPALDGEIISGRRLNAYNALTAPPGVTVITPNGGESWELGFTQRIRWSWFMTGPVVDIYLLKGADVYTQVAENIPNKGELTWEVPGSLPADSDYRIKITDGTYSDVSDEEFELLCPPITKPSYLNPCDGTTDVPVDANLVWNFMTITFDELPYGTVVDGMVIRDVTFGFSSSDATVTDEGPGYTAYVQIPNIEGDSEGTLTLDFDSAIPVFSVSYGFALHGFAAQASATTMALFDSEGSPLGSFSADARDRGYYFIEGLNSGTSTTPIAYAVITFSHPQAEFKRFALDNLTYSPIPGGLPEAATPDESGDMDEAESGEHQDANGTDGGYRTWSRPEGTALMRPEMAEAGVRTGVEFAVKEPAAPEAMAGSIGVMHRGGPDAGDYIFIDSDEPNGPSFDWIEVAAEMGTGTNLNLDDDDHFFGIELPFSFSFYGSNYNRVAVSSNGTIYFADWYLGFNNCRIPRYSGYGVQRFIAVYWDNLYPTIGGYDNVYYAVVGEAPNRILVVQWENVRHYSYYGTEDRVTCQAQLFEGSSDILLLYADPSLEAGDWATVGIQRDSRCGLNYLYNQAELHPGLAILFAHRPPCPTTWDVYFGTDPNTLELIESDLSKPRCDPTPEPNETLKRGTRYYWQVVAKNCCGQVDGNDWSFTTENTAPVADAGDNQAVECACNTNEGTKVTLDGTGSYDVDGNPLTYTWAGPFRESPAHGATPTVTLDGGCPGEHVIALIVNDGIEDSEPNDVVITVVDTTPPEFKFSVTPTVLWPPDHKMVKITPTWTVSDECDASPQVSLVSIVMNEGDGTIGDGHTTDDIRVDDDGSIYLRAERSGTDSGRIYSINYQAVDDCGNVTAKSATVGVPHDFGVLAKLAARWLWGGPAGAIPEDLNGDGIVNFTDFAKFAGNWIK